MVRQGSRVGLYSANVIPSAGVFPRDHSDMGSASLLPPPSGFPSDLTDASARPTRAATPQQIEGCSALAEKQPCALPSPFRRDGLFLQMASLLPGYDEDSPNSTSHGAFSAAA